MDAGGVIEDCSWEEVIVLFDANLYFFELLWRVWPMVNDFLCWMD